MPGIKIIFALSAAILMAAAYVPYLRDMFAGKTKPHAYTWLIWLITQGTALAALIYGHGGYAAWTVGFMEAMTLVVLALSFKNGTKNITRGDTALLALSFIAILIWWQLKNPLWSVFLVTAIDLFGYWPTFRKSFEEPWSESLLSWGIFSAGNFLSILALSEYNFLTLTYLLVAGLIPNMLLVALCLYRRRLVSKPFGAS